MYSLDNQEHGNPESLHSGPDGDEDGEWVLPDRGAERFGKESTCRCGFDGGEESDVQQNQTDEEEDRDLESEDVEKELTMVGDGDAVENPWAMAI